MAETTLEQVFEGAPGRIWVLMLLRGVLATVIGVYALLNPVATLIALVWVLGFYWLVDGIFVLFTGLKGTAGASKWWLVLLRAVLGIIAGLLILLNPFLGIFTEMVIVYFIAAWAVVTGVVEIAAAIRARKHIDNGWVLLLNGVLSFVFGVMLFINPLLSAVVLTQIMGCFAVFFGICAMYFSFRLRGMQHKGGGAEKAAS